jgi:hypothetical protein
MANFHCKSLFRGGQSGFYFYYEYKFFDYNEFKNAESLKTDEFNHYHNKKY